MEHFCRGAVDSGTNGDACKIEIGRYVEDGETRRADGRNLPQFNLVWD